MISPSCALFRFPQDLNDEFLREYGRRSVRVVRAAAMLSLAVCLSFAFWPGPLPSAATGPLVMRIYLGLMAPSLLAWFGYTFWKRASRRLHWASSAVGFFALGLGSIEILFLVPERARLYQPAGAMLVTMLFYAGLRLPFLWAVSVGGLFSVSFLAAVWRLGTDPAYLSLALLYLLSTNALGMYVAYSLERSLRIDFLNQRKIAAERERSEKLLLNVLPKAVAKRLKAGEKVIADEYREATILFADIVGYTGLAGRMPAAELVEILGDVFSRFDRLTEESGAEKIKTIGDAYMAVGGVPEALPRHPDVMAGLALGMLQEVSEINAERGSKLELRVGLHCGPVVAGVIGSMKFSYDLWGDAVNVASRMESHGVVGKVHLTESVASRLSPRYRAEKRGTVEVKGKGPMTTFLLSPNP